MAGKRESGRGIRPDEEDGKREERLSLSGQPPKCWREDVTVDAPKLNLSESEKNV